MDSNEAWIKFIETGRVDYYLLSRGIDVYAQGYITRPQSLNSAAVDNDRGETDESDGFGSSAEGKTVG